MYQALYRKWRPQTFEEVIGQQQVTQTLKNQVINDRLSHAYLFIGSRGTGSSTLLTGVRRHIALPRSGIHPCCSGLQVTGHRWLPN